MTRREFIALFGGGVAASTLAARAQQAERIRKIGVLMNLSSEDPEGQARVKAYAQALQKLGWIEGGNVRTEIRWAANDPDRYRRYSEELVALAPDVILASGTASVVALSELLTVCRSCSQMSAIRLALGSSAAWHGRAGTPLDLLRSTTV